MRDWVAVSLCMGLAFFIYRRVLGAYFSPDDFILLERARGLAPVPATIWRALSGTAYWWVAARVFGGNPLPYHVVMLTLHAANVALLFVLIRRMGGSVAVATLASGAFATSRLFFSAIYPASSVGELAG